MVNITQKKIQSLHEPKLTDNALFILKQRYLKRNKDGTVIETPSQMFRRTAKAIAAAELIYNPKADINAWESRFYRLMANLKFLPNSPTLLNAGRKRGQLSACFAIPISNSAQSISSAINSAAIIHRSGGGTGFSFSDIGSDTGNLVPLLHRFSETIGAIKQGGIRQGCNMAVLKVNHPEIMHFISAKDNPDMLTNFYLSVAVNSEFMEAVKTGSDYNLIDPHSHQVTKRLNARDVFNNIVGQTWKTGDPGIVFIDRIEDANPTPNLGIIEGVCGCGEQILLPYESSNLGSINLTKILKLQNGTAEIDYGELAKTIRIAVRFLDNVIDINQFPLSEIEEITKQTRKIGLGVMGFADMVIQLGIPYDSQKAVDLANWIMHFINKEARKASAILAHERGAFPAFHGSIYDLPGGSPPRNASCTTIAPTGTISMIAGCSSSIEPIFAIVFVRNLHGGGQLLEVNPYFEKIAKNDGFYSAELMKMLACGNQLSTFKEVPQDIKRLFVTAPEIKPEWHIKMQAAFQKNTDSAVSKTVNLPETATCEDIAGVYMLAYAEKLKGITVYRNGSRQLQPLSNSDAGFKLMCQWLSA